MVSKGMVSKEDRVEVTLEILIKTTPKTAPRPIPNKVGLDKKVLKVHPALPPDNGFSMRSHHPASVGYN